MSRRLRIDVFFDLICPWCLIGKRQLERALVQLRANQADVEVELVWHGVQLLPDMPVQGEPFAEFYRQRLGLWISRAEDSIGQGPVPDWAPAEFPHAPGTPLPLIRIFAIQPSRSGPISRIGTPLHTSVRRRSPISQVNPSGSGAEMRVFTVCPGEDETHLRTATVPAA